MDQYELIRTAHRVYGKNVSELSRMTGHSRNTVKKAIRGEPWGYKERQHQPFDERQLLFPSNDNYFSRQFLST